MVIVVIIMRSELLTRGFISEGESRRASAHRLGIETNISEGIHVRNNVESQGLVCALMRACALTQARTCACAGQKCAVRRGCGVRARDTG